MTMGKLPTTLGENQFESFSLFSEYCFYSDAEIYTAKKLQQLRNKTYLENHAKLQLDFRAHKKKVQPSKQYE